MQTLGLSSESKRSDGRLKSIFWPTVENAWDVNYLGQQGFWICLVIAVFQMIATSLVGTPLFLVLGAVTFLIFFMGGMGVREASWPAAALVFTIFFAGMVDAFTRGRPPGVLTIIAAGVLLSNIRAAFLASEWQPAAEGEDRPTRFNETLSDKLVDQLPARAWPILKVPFFIIASLYLLLIFIGFAADIVHRFGTI
jgi:hypothetical protein